MERRGQVFLIAAIIVVGALVSISSIFNAARARSSNEQFYDLSRVTGQTTVVPIQVVRQEEARVTPNQQTGEVSVAIDGAEYVFKLLSGENFFFVIIKEENDEAFVAAG